MNTPDILKRVRSLLETTATDPYLVGYDVNEIQAFVTASSRPIAMHGASSIIGNFDQREEGKSIFAGGGRGIQVVSGKDAAKTRCEELQCHFRDVTRGGTLAAMFVKFDKENVRASLLWLRQLLDLEKEAISKPIVVLPCSKNEQCKSCHANRGTVPRPRNGEEQLICPRCDAMIKKGGTEYEMAQSLNDLSETGRVAAISADGNNFGDLFDGLNSLEELALVSVAVREMFGDARKVAKSRVRPRALPNGHTIPRVVSVAVGGDDVRAFVADEFALPFVNGFVSKLEEVSRQMTFQLASVPVVSESTRRKIATLGVGIGLISADSHFPAYRLMEYAHQMERSAKRLCSTKTQGTEEKIRFALDFSVLLSGDEWIEAFDEESRTENDIRPIPLTGPKAELIWKQAGALKDVPSRQRAIFSRAARSIISSAKSEMPIEETENLLRYQVARSRTWQDYFKACGADWTQRDQVAKFLPKQGLFDLLRLMGDSRDSI